MADTISSLNAVPDTIANDGSEASVISATILTDGAPAQAGVAVNWMSTGQLSATSSNTDENGIAQINVKAAVGAEAVTVTAATGDDTKNITISTYKPLPVPVVVNASSQDQYTLDHYDINHGVQAEVPIYDRVAMNQTVEFFWGTIDNYSFIVTPEKFPPYVINVSEDLSPDCLKDGTYNVYYVVTDVSGNSTKSVVQVITVADGGSTVPTLPEPVVAEADPYINISDASDGVNVAISYSTIKIGDLVTFYWTGFDRYAREIEGAQATGFHTVVDGETTINFTILKETFYPSGKGYEGYAEVYYTVESQGSTVLALSETKQCLVDTVAP